MFATITTRHDYWTVNGLSEKGSRALVRLPYDGSGDGGAAAVTATCLSLGIPAAMAHAAGVAVSCGDRYSGTYPHPQKPALLVKVRVVAE